MIENVCTKTIKMYVNTQFYTSFNILKGNVTKNGAWWDKYMSSCDGLSLNGKNDYKHPKNKFSNQKRNAIRVRNIFMFLFSRWKKNCNFNQFPEWHIDGVIIPLTELVNIFFHSLNNNSIGMSEHFGCVPFDFWLNTYNKNTQIHSFWTNV